MYDSQFTICDVLLPFAFAILAQVCDLVARISIPLRGALSGLPWITFSCHALPCKALLSLDLPYSTLNCRAVPPIASSFEGKRFPYVFFCDRADCSNGERSWVEVVRD